MTTLRKLIEASGFSGVVVAQDGNGSAFTSKGRLVEWDATMDAEYGHILMNKLSSAHISDDGIQCNYSSDEYIAGVGIASLIVRFYC